MRNWEKRLMAKESNYEKLIIVRELIKIQKERLISVGSHSVTEAHCGIERSLLELERGADGYRAQFCLRSLLLRMQRSDTIEE